MYMNFTTMTENDMYLVYGGRSEQMADLMEFIGMGFGIIAKLIDKIRSAFRDAQKIPAE